MREGILGQDAAIGLLERALATGRLPHALLFHGPAGTGKSTVARRLAAALLCGARPSNGVAACGRCSDCTRVDHGSHPDLFWITRLPKKESRVGGAASLDDDDEGGAASSDRKPFIVVSQIRELSLHAAYAPLEGRARVFVVEPADRMNAEAQNAILKTLEEPPPRATIVLAASRPHVLFPTVRSRCLSVGFAPMAPETLARGLEARGIGPEEARKRASLAAGRPGAAIALDVEALGARRDEILGMAERLAAPPKGLVDLAPMAKAFVGEGEESFLEGLDVLETLLRDAARAAAGGGGLVHADLATRVGRLGARIGTVRAARLVESVERVRADLRFHLNRTIAAEALLAAIAGGPPPLG